MSNTSNTANTTNTTADYLSYLLRLWRVQGDGLHWGHMWRASLHEPVTQEVIHFEDLQSLFAFLLAQTGQADVKRET
jgi:hypothetical protein